MSDYAKEQKEEKEGKPGTTSTSERRAKGLKDLTFCSVPDRIIDFGFSLQIYPRLKK